ncbi:MAG: ribosome maturation factor RimP [Oligoflexia bacterium]|nr:ribosome maturation factor RimP [Oligoflexia bacterium]
MIERALEFGFFLDLKRLEDTIRPLLEQAGYRLYDLEFVGRTLRVYIEKPGDSVGIDDCVETSRLLNPLLDVEDLIPGGRYELEVSSPGLERVLKRAEHFSSAVGSEVVLHTIESMEKWSPQDAFFSQRRKLKGKLTGFDGVCLSMESEGRQISLPMSALSKAHISFELEKGEKKGSQNKGKKGSA